MHTPFSLLWLALTVLVLASCTPQKTSDPDAIFFASPEAYQQSLQGIQSWQAQGKIAFHKQFHDGETHTRSARFSWRQQQEHFDITLSGPAGIGSGKVTGTSQAATLYSSKLEEPLYTETPEATLRQELGWQIPLQSLHHWIVGRIALQEISNPIYNPNNTLKSFQYQDWHIQYLAYKPVGDALLPTRIKLNNPTLDITLITKSWNIL